MDARQRLPRQPKRHAGVDERLLPGQAGYGLMAWLVLHTGWHTWLGLPDYWLGNIKRPGPWCFCHGYARYRDRLEATDLPALWARRGTGGFDPAALAAAGVSVWLVRALCRVATRDRTLARVSGVVGGLVIGMMVRTARGHTGRPLRADRRELAYEALLALIRSGGAIEARRALQQCQPALLTLYLAAAVIAA